MYLLCIWSSVRSLTYTTSVMDQMGTPLQIHMLKPYLVVRWMDLESVIQSEVSQKEKNKYRMLTHIYGILKKKKKVLMNLVAG